MPATCERAVTRNDFIPVSLAILIPERICGVALYTRDEASGSMRLFRGPEYPITKIDIQRLAASGRTRLYVSAPEHHEFQKYLRDNLEDVVQDESRGATERFATLNEVVRDVLGESFRKGNVRETIDNTQRLGVQTVELICREDVVVTDLRSVLYHDYHTFTHSANVAYYAVLLATRLGIDSKAELNQIATGALLHDLGKLQISDAVLTKPGKLDEREFSIIKQHPTTGFRKLCHREELSFAQLMMVYQHHERLDGKGYPVGVGGSEVHHWSRITSIVDVFEALTSNRPYRAGMSAKDAFGIMDRTVGTAFDEDLYECWKMTMQNS